MDTMPMTPPPTYNNQSRPMMHASFFWGKDVIILFSDWPGQDHIGMYVLALAMVFLLSMTVEIVSGSLSLKPRGSGSVKPAVAGAFVYAAVYAVKMGLAYLVMLSVMSFNVGCFLAAVFGHGLGCFVAKYRALVVISKAADSI